MRPRRHVDAPALAPMMGDGDAVEDAYAVLGVDRAASDAEVRRAYQRLALTHHPDRAPAGDAGGAGADDHADASVGGGSSRPPSDASHLGMLLARWLFTSCTLRAYDSRWRGHPELALHQTGARDPCARRETAASRDGSSPSPARRSALCVLTGSSPAVPSGFWPAH